MAFSVKPSSLSELDATLAELRRRGSSVIKTRARLIRAAYQLIDSSVNNRQIMWAGDRTFFAIQMPSSADPALKVKVNPNLKSSFGNDIAAFRQQLRLSLAFTAAQAPQERQLTTFFDYGYGSRGNGAREARIFYGCLDEYLGADHLDYSAFRGVCNEFAGGSLPSSVKEDSDIEGVSLINQAIFRAMNDIGAYGSCRSGITVKVGRYTFPGVIGCVPVTASGSGGTEPKADFCLARLVNENQIVPDCFISYKLGNNVRGFQQYGGTSSASGDFIFNHPEVLAFFTDLEMYVQNRRPLMINETAFDVSQLGSSGFWRPINDLNLMKASVIGLNYNGSNHGIDKCHMLGQGTVRLTGNARSRQYTLSFVHETFDYDNLMGLNEYIPVLGATFRTGRNSRGPNNITLNGMRVGIYAQGFRSNWVSNPDPWYNSGGTRFVTTQV